MRRAAELSPADWPRVVHGVRWHGRGRGIVLAVALITALLVSLVLAAGALAKDRSAPVVVVGSGSSAAVKAAGGKELLMHVVAEGTESEAQLERLRDLGCAMGQGFHLFPPLTGVALLDEPLSLGDRRSEGERDVTAA